MTTLPLNSISPGDDAPLCALKIFLRRGQAAAARSLWRRLFGPPLASQLVEDARRNGLVCGSVVRANLGFGPGATSVAAAWMADAPGDQLPVCVELVGTRERLERFAAHHAASLRQAALVLYEGNGVRLNLGQEVAS